MLLVGRKVEEKKAMAGGTTFAGKTHVGREGASGDFGLTLRLLVVVRVGRGPMLTHSVYPWAPAES